MSFFALLLILLSACLHIFQHVALKRARDRTSFIWWMWFSASVLFLPIPLLLWQSGSLLAWLILLGSAVFEALYYTAIAKAYQTGELSTVYPLARGTAPLFIVGWSLLFFQEQLTWGGISGIVLIVIGLSVINLRRLSEWHDWRRTLGVAAARWALLAGLCISCYTTMDKAGVKLLAPLLYTWLAMTLTVLWLTPGTLRAVGWQGLLTEWRASRWSIVFAGFTAMAAYMLVLYVLRSGTPASYVGATREISVVLGAVTGIVLLKEPGTVWRIGGSVLIASGVGIIALLG
ncbi:MAG TPA: DMT family transporter [Blastocatellia bacterium]|nr:DMT family transporter [Blastocatellia bacterium]